ncbi:MAG: ubiquinol-cytochrome C chaperone family protein [Sphingomicrobium sp.]
MRRTASGASLTPNEFNATLMLRLLFPRLTPHRGEPRGSALFAALVAAARRPHWYRAGGVADTVDGRFAVLATLAALTTVRLERGGAEGEAAAVALAERFVEAMDAEHREMGLGDPKLGRTVRKLMGALAQRVGLWRATVGGGDEWRAATADSLGLANADEAALTHAEAGLRQFWSDLDVAPDEAVASGALT